MSKTVVMIGDFTHEGITSQIKSLGFNLLPMRLVGVTPKTWLKRAEKISELQNDGMLVATVIYLHTTLLLEVSKGEYRQAFLKILEMACHAKTIVFVYQDNLDGIFTMRHAETREPMTLKQLEEAYFTAKTENRSTFRLEKTIKRLAEYRGRRDEVTSLISSLYESGAEVAPFFIRSDVTIRLQEFLNDAEQGVFLRLFVANDRFQADQLQSLLSVLERYLRQVENQNFSINSQKSSAGIVYIFRTDEKINNLQGLNEAFNRFDTFMEMCGDDPKQAEIVLRNRGIKPDSAAYLVDKFAKEYRRLILDTRHEFERKSLSLRQKLESEMIDQDENMLISWPKENLAGLISAAATGGNVEINIGSVNVSNQNKIQNEANKIFSGTFDYNNNDKLLLEFITKYTDGLEALQYRSDLDQLKDKTIAEPARRNAVQRLKGFLRKVAIKAGDLATKATIEILSRYLEAQIKGIL